MKWKTFSIESGERKSCEWKIFIRDLASNEWENVCALISTSDQIMWAQKEIKICTAHMFRISNFNWLRTRSDFIRLMMKLCKSGKNLSSHLSACMSHQYLPLVFLIFYVFHDGTEKAEEREEKKLKIKKCFINIWKKGRKTKVEDHWKVLENSAWLRWIQTALILKIWLLKFYSRNL